MATHAQRNEEGGIFFCTFACWEWLPLIEATGLYDHILGWFRYLRTQGIGTVGYVIMPNHVHVLLDLPPDRSINTVLANGKRFMAYEVGKRLEAMNDERYRFVLRMGVSSKDERKGQKLRVFKPSSDIKHCRSLWFLEQKLHYIHNNPLQEHWKLAADPAAYRYSSAAFYHRQEPGPVEITDYRDLFRSGSLRRS